MYRIIGLIALTATLVTAAPIGAQVRMPQPQQPIQMPRMQPMEPLQIPPMQPMPPIQMPQTQMPAPIQIQPIRNPLFCTTSCGLGVCNTICTGG